MTTAIWWARRDLRLSDNQALSAALAHAEWVIPVFVLDPTLLEAHRAAEKRVAFLFGGLRALDDSLRARGGYLVVRHGDPADELAAFVAESGAEAVFAEEDLTPYARQRDGRVAARMPLRLVGAPVVHLPGSVLKTDGTPYTVFTPFGRKWKALTPPTLRNILPAPTHIATPAEIASLPIPTEPALEPSVPFPLSEAEAHRRLSVFSGEDDPPIGAADNPPPVVGTVLIPYKVLVVGCNLTLYVPRVAPVHALAGATGAACGNAVSQRSMVCLGIALKAEARRQC